MLPILLLLAGLGLILGSSLIPDEEDLAQRLEDEFGFSEDEDDPRASDPATEGPDFIEDLGDGAQRVSGGAGNDLLGGGKGWDVLRGGSGNDVLFGDEGRDVLAGNSGADVLEGGTSDDILDGGSGQDQLIGGEGQDLLFGTEGVDFLAGGTGDDVLSGGTGQDILNGEAGNDILTGGNLLTRDPETGEWRDYRDEGGDLLTYGFDAPTFISVQDDNAGDALAGGDGNDAFFVGHGDVAKGGQDADFFGIIHDGQSGDVPTVTDFQQGEDIISIINNTNATPAVTLRTDGADSLILLDGETAARVENAAETISVTDIAVLKPQDLASYIT